MKDVRSSICLVCTILVALIDGKSHSQLLDSQYKSQMSEYEKGQQWCRKAYSSAQFTGNSGSDDYRHFITSTGVVWSVSFGYISSRDSCGYEKQGLVAKETKKFDKNTGCTYTHLFKIENNELVKYWNSSCDPRVRRVFWGKRR